MKQPNFYLSACPHCSSFGDTIRPRWVYARNTSERRGKPCYIFSGCEHAQPAGAIAVSFPVRDEPDEWARVEKNWERFASEELAKKLATMTTLAADRFRRALANASALPGATDALPLEPLEQQKADATTKTVGEWLE